MLYAFLNNMDNIVVVANGDNDLIWLKMNFGLCPLGVIDLGILHQRSKRRQERASFTEIIKDLLGKFIIYLLQKINSCERISEFIMCLMLHCLYS